MEDENVIDEAVAELLGAAQERFRYEHARLIGTAAYYAARAHEGQKRKSGGPYILHPIRVAQFLLELDDRRIDVATVCAALLHDVIEDTQITLQQLEKQFGRDVEGLVSTLTKKRIDGSKQEEDQQYFDQLKRHEKSDPRVLLIKLADVLDNAQTIEVNGDGRRQQRAQNIIEFYAPLARRLERPDIAKRLVELAEPHV